MKNLLLFLCFGLFLNHAQSQNYNIATYNGQTVSTDTFPCQQIIAGIDTAICNPTPSALGYIDVCFGDSVTLGGTALFPENDLFYHQSIATSRFVWTFGDGYNDTGIIVNHLYQNGGFYTVSLVVYDSMNCMSYNQLNLKVRISEAPTIIITHPDTIPAFTNYTLSAGINPGNTVVISPYNHVVTYFSQQDSAMLIPDGGALGGLCFNSYLNVNKFPPGQTVTNASDIKAVTVNMEHSFMGDLEISVICPNGQSAILKEYVQSGGAYLGIPMGGDNHHDFDCNAPPSCVSDPAQNPPGTGWTYTFTPLNPEYNTMQSYGNSGNTNPHPSGINGAIIDSGSYLPYQNYNNLIGCPLNGLWNIKVCDYWGVDNGWVFFWRLEFDTTIAPQDSAFTIPIDSIFWNGPFITQNMGDSILITPQQPGEFQYTLTLIDAFGCTYDTVITVYVSGNIGIPDDESIEGKFINLFPNPATHEIILDYILSQQSDIKIYIRNSLGQIIQEKSQTNIPPGKNTSSFNLLNVKPGLYTVEIEINNGISVNQIHKKFIVSGK